jgi:hypothetical protein
MEKLVKVVSIDEEFGKSRVKAHTRTRKGKIERVKEFNRRGVQHPTMAASFTGPGEIYNVGGDEKNFVKVVKIKDGIVSYKEISYTRRSQDHDPNKDISDAGIKKMSVDRFNRKFRVKDWDENNIWDYGWGKPLKGVGTGDESPSSRGYSSAIYSHR